MANNTNGEETHAQDFQKQFAVIACGLPLVALIKALNQPAATWHSILVSVLYVKKNGELIK